MKVITGHQPAYLPWLGLFHKISLCDVFVVMDDVQYLSQDWNNRNRIKGPNGAFWLTVPIDNQRSASKALRDIRIHSQNWGKRGHWQFQHWESIRRAYARSPYWPEHASFLEAFYTDQEHKFLVDANERLFRYFLRALGMQPKIIVATEFGFEGQKSDLVLDHCLKLEADVCVLGSQGRDYARIEDFRRNKISVYFDDYKHPTYQQLYSEFVSHLSILDLLLNHGPDSLNILMEGNMTREDLETLVSSCPREM